MIYIFKRSFQRMNCKGGKSASKEARQGIITVSGRKTMEGRARVVAVQVEKGENL